MTPSRYVCGAIGAQLSLAGDDPLGVIIGDLLTGALTACDPAARARRFELAAALLKRLQKVEVEQSPFDSKRGPT